MELPEPATEAIVVDDPEGVEDTAEATYAGFSANLHTPCATHVFPDGTVDVDAIVGKVALLIDALNIAAPDGSGGGIIPVIFLLPVLRGHFFIIQPCSDCKS